MRVSLANLCVTVLFPAAPNCTASCTVSTIVAPLFAPRHDRPAADCELLYQLYAPEIAARFPRTSLDEWIKKYMGDDHSPTDVEQRADQLRKLITHHREQVIPTPQFTTLPELAAWFQQQKSEIEALPVDDRLRRTLLANLNVRNAELMNELFDKL